ncbi:MAG TPA: hypothetical protein VIH42_03165 [Thermoguttaceae bacterium]
MKNGKADLRGPTPDQATNDNRDRWSKPNGPSQWAKFYGISVDTMIRRFQDGKIRNKKLSTKSYRVHVDDLPKQ